MRTDLSLPRYVPKEKGSCFSRQSSALCDYPASIYNEVYVAERLIDAVAAIDYPAEKTEIQVLDDSTDETTEVIARK
jgi:hypothetical protein